ncbi:MAG: hypothetical protein Q7T63_06630 [Burkholderiaceae bacterium]|nr:hypothetical protein [Burkholderiaceae bacterium]MDO9089205.1 hypothetical protein [Burkholderiaceae bacterium]
MLAALATGAPSVIGLTPTQANGEEVQKVYKVMEEHAPLVWEKVNELDLPLDRTGENGGISVLSLSPANQSVLPFAKRVGDILNSSVANRPSAA